MLKRPHGRASPALPLFEARRHKGSACGWCLSLGLRLALLGSLVLLICGFVGLVLWQGTGGGADDDDGDDGGAVEVSLVRSVQSAREEEGKRLVVPPTEPSPVGPKKAASERGVDGVKRADDWFKNWAARQESAGEDDEPQLTTATGTRETGEEAKRPNSKGGAAAKKSVDPALPRSPCPYFTSINATSVVVHWQHPSTKVLWCELKAKPTHGTARAQLVYEGLDTDAEMRNLKPVTEYRFSLLCRHSEESREKTMRACGRRLTTRGSHNLVANPSFEDRGPQHYVKYFDPNYMKLDPNSFPAYWRSMMTPIELCTDRAMTGLSSMCFKSPDKANYKYGASQFVLINTTTAQTTRQGGQENEGSDHDEEGEETELGGATTKRYLLLSAWSAAKDVSGKRDGGYGIGLQIKFADGSHSYGHKMTWRTEDHRWEKECMVIETEQGVMSVNIFILFLDHAGTVWFDDLFLAATTTIEPGFEGCRVERADTPVRHGCCPNRYTVRSALSPDPKGVSIATQLTIDRLPSLRMMAQNWDGPISAAVFVMDEAEVDEVFYFRSTWDKLADNIDFHLVISERNYAYKTLGLYPVNTLRNIALVRCRTEHALILDADFIPSPDSYSVIMDTLPRLGRISEGAHEPDSPGVVWVVPAFEIEPGVPLPDSRKELVEMSRQDLIRQVHEVKWAPAHAPTNYTAWMNSSEPYEITFRPEYEPYMMVPRDSVPLYDERFIGYGYDKVAQATELNIAGYRFFGLPEVFVIHYDHGVPKWRGKGDVMRSRVFQNFYSFLGEVELAYKTWPPRRHSRQPERVAEYDADTDADVIKAAFKKKQTPPASS